MKLNKISLKDKKTFSYYLGLSRHRLSAYSFENIYIWKRLFEIFWVVIEDNLCLFFKDKIGCFMYLPPLGGKATGKVLEEVFRIVNNFNSHPGISRIENVEKDTLKQYHKLGCAYQDKFCEYLYRRRDLVELKGKRFKSKRACCNYFSKHYDFKYLNFSPKYKKECLELYGRWANERKQHAQDTVYAGMLKDSGICLRQLLHSYKYLGFSGRVVRIAKEVKGFSFGFALNKEIFCVLYEVADLSVKGLAQFIFRGFCHDCGSYKYINIMDDSGIDNLARTKFSYHPLELIPSYIIHKNN
ncbi:MAG: phosphatidylglycerol lysyltransferase domain-containing protein [Candidatus Omnitrophota bacterium]|nr:phosphatidylglycerol lysyltransferase domain-containing protein [Candidatus Omnitrophota bacterium]